MWKEKLGNALIDIAKYFITGVLVTSLVKDLEGVRWLIYLLSTVAAAILFAVGIKLVNDNKNKPTWEQ